jgi:hypothetical protein
LLAALRAGAFSFLPMLGPTVSFTNLKFNVSEFHLLSVCYLLLPFFLSMATHFAAAMYLMFCFKFLEMQESAECF